MQHAINFNSPGAHSEPDSDFSVLIAYEDFESGKHAKRTYDFLVQKLGRECRFSNQMWKFEVFNIPKLREMAAKDAAAADIIIISLRNGSAISPQVRNWIDSWFAQPRNAIALVALFQGPGEDSLPTKEAREYLAQVAKRSGMEFFAQPASTESILPSVQPGQKPGGARTFSILAGAVSRDLPASHWGINE